MSWAHYLLQVNIYLIVFFCFYKLLLDKETYFILNRVYLIGSGLLSIAIPFMRFEWLTTQPVAQQVYTRVDQLNVFVSQVSKVNTKEQFDWGSLVVAIYVLGILFFIGRFIFQLLAVRKMLSSINSGMAFSFLNKKVIDRNVPEPATINLHEEIHIKQKHTIDVLFFEILGVFNWFNPIIYAYKYTIKNIHEFLADEAAAKFQGNKEEYSLLLLSQAFGARPSDLTNGFFTKSLIKKRIFMLHKQRSKKTAILKYGLFVPLFALTLILSSATIRKNDQLIEVAAQIPLNNIKYAVSKTIEAPLKVVDIEIAPAAPEELQTVEIKDKKSLSAKNKNWTTFYSFLVNTVKYPNTLSNANARVNFSVKNGQIKSANIIGDLGAEAEKEIKNTILAYNNEIPVKDGNYTFVADFKLNSELAKIESPTIAKPSGYAELPSLVVTGYTAAEATIAKQGDNNIYNFVMVENPPTYPGGMEKFYQYLAATTKYPLMASENNIQGTVLLSFTVEKDGSLTDIKVDRKVGYGLDEEAVRVIKESKRWNPGLQNGIPVRVKYNIPIKFTMPTVIVKPVGIVYNGEPSSEPAVVIDGIRGDFALLKDFNADDIESIDVIKDVTAAALYGKPATKNGILLITTKKAKN